VQWVKRRFVGTADAHGLKVFVLITKVCAQMVDVRDGDSN
jgi:hypothetical protein